MEQTKITVEKGRTIISEKKRQVNKITTMNMPQQMVNNMHNQTTPNNDYQGLNINNIASLLPLLKTGGVTTQSTNNLNKILEILPNLTNNNGNNNLISQLLPLLQTLNKQKEDKKEKISSLKRTDED